jgi:tetratricopeptide (TPR) repeat protein
MNCPRCGQELNDAAHVCPARPAEPPEEFVDVFLSRLVRLDAIPALESYLQQLLPHLEPRTVSLLLQHLPAVILRSQPRSRAEVIRKEAAAWGAEIKWKAVSPTRPASPDPFRPYPDADTPLEEKPPASSSRVWQWFLLGALVIGLASVYLPDWLSKRMARPVTKRPLTWQPPSPGFSPQLSSSPSPQSGSTAAPPDPRRARIQSLLEQSVREFKNHQYAEAIQTCGQVLELEPNHTTAKRNLSLIYCQVGSEALQKNELDKAKDLFKESLEALPEAQCAFRGLGLAYFYQEDLDPALDWLNRYFDAGGEQADAYALISEIYYRRNELRKALEFLRMAAALDPNRKDWQDRVEKLEREIKVEKNFLASDTRHFVVKYQGYEQAEVGSWVMTLLEEAYIRVGGELHYYPQNPITAILYTDQQFQDVTHLPAWAGAAYDGKIRIPAKGLRQGDETVERLVVHEYTHAVIHLWSRGRAPTWIHEGMAQSLSGETPDAAAFRMASAGAPLIPLNLLEGAFIRLPEIQAKLAYSESLLAVQFIKQTYGDYAVRVLIEALADGKSMDQALQNATYLNYEQFNKKFFEWAVQNYESQ